MYQDESNTNKSEEFDFNSHATFKYLNFKVKSEPEDDQEINESVDGPIIDNFSNVKTEFLNNDRNGTTDYINETQIKKEYEHSTEENISIQREHEDVDLNFKISEVDIKSECFNYELNETSDHFHTTWIKTDNDIDKETRKSCSAEKFDKQQLFDIDNAISDTSDNKTKQLLDPLDHQSNFKCDMCDKTFKNYKGFRIHTFIHTGKKTYQCDICKKTFKLLAHLKSHQQTHTGEKPYECDICNKRFTRLYHINIHKRTHTGEKPYQCDVCHKYFNRLSNLATHKRIHTDDKPYECDLCHKRFIVFSHLTRHIRTHTGEKPYECDVCHKKFKSSSNVKNHKRLLHNIN